MLIVLCLEWSTRQIPKAGQTMCVYMSCAVCMVHMSAHKYGVMVVTAVSFSLEMVFLTDMVDEDARRGCKMKEQLQCGVALSQDQNLPGRKLSLCANSGSF